MEFVITIIISLFLTFKYLQYILKKFKEFCKQDWEKYRNKYIMLVVNAPFIGLLTVIIAQIIAQIIIRIYNFIT